MHPDAHIRPRHHKYDLREFLIHFRVGFPIPFKILENVLRPLKLPTMEKRPQDSVCHESVILAHLVFRKKDRKTAILVQKTLGNFLLLLGITCDDPRPANTEDAAQFGRFKHGGDTAAASSVHEHSVLLAHGYRKTIDHKKSRGTSSRFRDMSIFSIVQHNSFTSLLRSLVNNLPTPPPYPSSTPVFADHSRISMMLVK